MKISQGKFVITGGVSLIGSHVAEILLEQGAREIVLFDNFSLGSTDLIGHLMKEPRVKIVRGDILRINELVDACKDADGVFAIAAFLTLPLSQNPQYGVTVNVQGHLNLLEACRYAGVKKVVFSSSTAIYGDPVPGRMDEKSPLNLAPFSPAAALYSASKVMGENLCRLYDQRYGIQGVSLRYTTVYGERQHYRGVNALYIAENYDKILRNEAPVIPEEGLEVHDYIHVVDVTRANVMAMASDVSGESFNISTGGATNLNVLVELLLKAMGSKLKPTYDKAPKGVRASTAQQMDFANDKAREMLGWTPQIDLAEGIRRFVEWRRQIAKAA
ncbi:NAD-dependent epimerase/dehydratase family protein [soil metagenome]